MLLSFIIMRLPTFALISAALYFVQYFLRGKKLNERPLIRHILMWVLICYFVSLVYLTLLWYWPDITFTPEWHFLNLRPFVWVSEVYVMGAAKMAEQLVLNIGMFVPFGLLVPAAFSRMRSFWRTAGAALCSTLFIETVQYFMGRSADIDDVIMNLAGGMLGYALYALCNLALSRTVFWQKAIGK